MTAGLGSPLEGGAEESLLAMSVCLTVCVLKLEDDLTDLYMKFAIVQLW